MSENRAGPTTMLRRERLLEVLRRRHHLRLLVIEAPAGFGRTTLLRQALDEPAPPHTHDRFIDIPMGGSLRVALGDVVAADASDEVAIIIDDAHRASDAAPTIVELLAGLPDGVHLVVSARPGHLPSFARAVADGSARRLTADDLAFQPDEVMALIDEHRWDQLDPELASWPAVARLASSDDPQLVVDYLREEVLADLDPTTVRALGAIALAGGGGPQFVESVLALLGADTPTRDTADTPTPDPDPDTVRRQLGRLPLVTLSDAGCWPHPVWARAAEPRLTGVQRRTVLARAADDRLAEGALAAAGELAVRAADPDALARCVRAALASQPPLVPLEVLCTWDEAALLDGHVERAWLEGVIETQQGSTAEVTLARLERARAAYEAAGDAEGEAAVLLHLGTLARKTNNATLLVSLLPRADALAVEVPAALVLQSLGHALIAQLAGDPDRAVAALESLPVGAVRGDWAAQVHMVRGTNQAFAGRPDDARRSLTQAAGMGSAWSRAVATDLLAAVTWTMGDVDGALQCADDAARLAAAGSAHELQAMICAARACMLALDGHDIADALGPLSETEAASTETARLVALATIISCIQSGDLVTAVEQLRSLPPPVGRPMRSTTWRAALEVALLPERTDEWQTLSATHPPLRPAVRAGQQAAAHLAGGPPVDERHRPYVPSCWYAPSEPVVHLHVLGGATVVRGRTPVDEPGWRRARVRELALHLALRTTVGREGVATALWPDLGTAAAARNLRVTLSHLLDVLDPARERGSSSELLVDADGVLHFAEHPRLRIDVRELERHAEAVIASRDRTAAVSAGRRLLAAGSGPLLGGAAGLEWLEPIRRRLDELVLRAAGKAGDAALDAGDGELAAALADRMLAIDPWAEHAHRLAIASRLAVVDLDGARRAVADTWRALAELGVTPQPATVELARQAGFRRLPTPDRHPS